MTTSQKRRGPKPTGTAMTSAERQRRYIERLKAGAKADNPVTNADDEAASDSVRIAKGELERLRAECLSSADTISRLSKDRDILTGQIRKLDGAADTIERLRADLAARDVEIQRLKTEVAQAQEKAAAARARESGYREQIDRLESRISQVGCPANRQTDENGDRDSRILALSGLSEVKVSETLKAEGIKCSPRTVGNVRRRHRAERPEAAGPVTSSAAGVNRSVQTIKK